MPVLMRKLAAIPAALGLLFVALAQAAPEPVPRPIPEPLPEPIVPRFELNLCRLAVRYVKTVNPRSAVPVLQLCPRIRNQLVWEKGNGERVRFRDWSDAQRARFFSLFRKLMRDEEDLGLKCPLPGARISTHPGLSQIYLREDEAFDIYAAHAAHALVLEVRGSVPWSIVGLPLAELRAILASYNYHSVIPSNEGFLPPGIEAGRDFKTPHRHIIGDGLNCDPRVGYRYVRGETSKDGKDLVGADPEETLSNLSKWFAENVGHGDEEDLVKSRVEDHAYLENRLRNRAYRAPERVIFAPLGCHSASSLLHDLARSVNLPLLVVTNYESAPADPPSFGCRGACHRGLAFRFGRPEVRVLWHTDDLYAMQYAEFFPVRESDGTRLTAAEKQRLFFDTHWLPLSELSAWGFALSGALPAVAPRFPEVDLYVGYWPRMGAMLSLEWEKKYRLCNWGSYLAAAGEGTRLHLESHLKAYGPLRLLHSMDEFVGRGLRCLSEWGGYEKVSSLAAEYERARGGAVHLLK